MQAGRHSREGDTSSSPRLLTGAAHGVKSAIWVFLVLCVCFSPLFLGWGCTASPQDRKVQQLGMPLSHEEYQQFFRLFQAGHFASKTCLLRMSYGCKNPLIQRLDKYENHGVIPEGPICSELPEIPLFPDFCSFSVYRCLKKKYFIKRTACPGETKVAVISNSIPDLKKAQLNPSDTYATEVTASGQQQEQLPSSDMQDLYLRLQDIHVQSSLQTLQQLLTRGKAVGDKELQAAAQKVLLAMNNASVSQRAASTDKGHREEK